MKIIFSFLLAIVFASDVEAAPATLAKGNTLNVMSGSTRIGSRGYPVGTKVDAVPGGNNKVQVTAEDGATALLPADAVIYAPTPTPLPSVSPVVKSNPTPPAETTDLKTVSGKVYKQARVFRVEPDGINYVYADGIVKVPFADLPENVQKQYGYDPEKARKFALQDAAEQQETAAAQEKALQAITHAKNTNEILARVGFYMSGKIIQVTDNGVLIDASLSREVIRSREVDVSTSLEKRSTAESYKDIEMDHLDEPVFVYSVGDSYVDGDHFGSPVWLVGKHRYTAVSGAGKTVRAFSASKADAAKRIDAARE